MNTVLKYPGAKNRLASWIVSFIPEHDVYLEPFFRSGAVLFNKPRSHIEIVNDLNNEVVNCFRGLQDYPDELAYQINLTLYSREEYDNLYHKKNEVPRELKSKGKVLKERYRNTSRERVYYQI